MKLYRVVKSFFDGDHEYGQYESPMFINKTAAVLFKQKVWDSLEKNDPHRWWSDDDFMCLNEPVIEELEIIEQCPVCVEKSGDYLT